MNTKVGHLKQSLEIKNSNQVGRESNNLNLDNRGEIRLPPISFFFDKNIILPQLSDLSGNNIINMADANHGEGHGLDEDGSFATLADLIGWDAGVLTREFMGILDSNPPVVGSEQPHMPSGLNPSQEALYCATYFNVYMNLVDKYRMRFGLGSNSSPTA